ncbi:hypothetical protein C8Q72DRAFT_897598 [Fomitopsis betulina]|nr:hypothetical protein C8Q72DRAFT_897598 [Fomitopsis betulina]
MCVCGDLPDIVINPKGRQSDWKGAWYISEAALGSLYLSSNATSQALYTVPPSLAYMLGHHFGVPGGRSFTSPRFLLSNLSTILNVSQSRYGPTPHFSNVTGIVRMHHCVLPRWKYHSSTLPHAHSEQSTCLVHIVTKLMGLFGATVGAGYYKVNGGSDYQLVWTATAAYASKGKPISRSCLQTYLCNFEEGHWEVGRGGFQVLETVVALELLDAVLVTSGSGICRVPTRSASMTMNESCPDLPFTRRPEAYMDRLLEVAATMLGTRHIRGVAVPKFTSENHAHPRRELAHGLPVTT